MNACTSVVALEEGNCIHEEIVQIGYEWSVLVDSSFIAMYAKCGSLEDMQNNVQHDVFSWTIVLGGYAMHGQATRALVCFQEILKDLRSSNGYGCFYCSSISM